MLEPPSLESQNPFLSGLAQFSIAQIPVAGIEFSHQAPNEFRTLQVPSERRRRLEILTDRHRLDLGHQLEQSFPYGHMILDRFVKRFLKIGGR